MKLLTLINEKTISTGHVIWKKRLYRTFNLNYFAQNLAKRRLKRKVGHIVILTAMGAIMIKLSLIILWAGGSLQ